MYQYLYNKDLHHVILRHRTFFIWNMAWTQSCQKICWLRGYYCYDLLSKNTLHKL